MRLQRADCCYTCVHHARRNRRVPRPDLPALLFAVVLARGHAVGALRVRLDMARNNLLRVELMVMTVTCLAAVGSLMAGQQCVGQLAVNFPPLCELWHG